MQKVPSVLRRMWLPAYDAGTEANTARCSDMAAPACPEGSANANPQPGEGRVHVHRGMLICFVESYRSSYAEVGYFALYLAMLGVLLQNSQAMS